MTTTFEAEYTQFMQLVSSLLPINLQCYKPKQMERRIRDLARKHQASDLITFATMLRGDRDILREFEQHITINVSEFYRNPEAFDYLAQRVLEPFKTRLQAVRVWSAGCSNGSEPYTMAMLLLDTLPGRHHTIYATDIDRAMLEKAQRGTGYTSEDVRGLPARLRDKYMSRDGTSLKVSDDILRIVRFDRHDLLRDKVQQSFDIVACRNVVIYFTDEAKAELYYKFADALEPGGMLFIGATETISRPSDYGLQYVAPCFYVKASR